jgi:FdhD protein
MAEPISEAFLLCGGESERLGFPKEMVRVDGVPLAVALVERLREVLPSVAVISNHPAYLETWLDAPIYRDEYPGLGPLAGIHAGLKRTEGRAAFFLGCDMPLVTSEAVRRLVNAETDSDAVIASNPGGLEPLCAVYSTRLLPAIQQHLEAGDLPPVAEFLDSFDARHVDFEKAMFRDIDRPADLAILRRAFDEVEPLPVARTGVRRIGAEPMEEDSVAVERAFDFRVNGVRLATIQALPGGLREMTVGFLSYLGLIEDADGIQSVEVDYEAGRIEVGADVTEDDLQNAFRLQISSSCGAGIYGPPLPEMAVARDGFRVSAQSILDCVHRLRAMAPAFGRTGGTHQAAFHDGERIVQFAEDVGRHNAIDKVVGRCLMAGTDTSKGFLAATGRLNAQMIIKALRQRIPVVASRSAATTGALEIADKYGVTVVGFARGHRTNVYTCPQRVYGE